MRHLVRLSDESIPAERKVIQVRAFCLFSVGHIFIREIINQPGVIQNLLKQFFFVFVMWKIFGSLTYRRSCNQVGFIKNNLYDYCTTKVKNFGLISVNFVFSSVIVLRNVTHFSYLIVNSKQLR